MVNECAASPQCVRSLTPALERDRKRRRSSNSCCCSSYMYGAWGGLQVKLKGCVSDAQVSHIRKGFVGLFTRFPPFLQVQSAAHTQTHFSCPFNVLPMASAGGRKGQVVGCNNSFHLGLKAIISWPDLCCFDSVCVTPRQEQGVFGRGEFGGQRCIYMRLITIVCPCRVSR